LGAGEVFNTTWKKLLNRERTDIINRMKMPVKFHKNKILKALLIFLKTVNN